MLGVTIPDYQTIMLPILEYLADGTTRQVVPEVTGFLAKKYNLTAEDLEQQIPSGRTSTLANRSHWAVTYMVKAGLLERPVRGRVTLTAAGKAALGEGLARVDNEYLAQFPSFIEFKAKTREHQTEQPVGGPSGAAEQNPEELLYSTYATLRKSVEAEILERLQSESLLWEFFEDLVVDLLVAMGFGGNVEETGRRVTKRSGDDGIDGVIDEDRLGLDAIYIQAKKYGPKTPVGRPALQAFAGSLEGQRAAKGVFITTSYFTGEAADYVRRISRRIVLIDGATLARHMYDHGIGVRTTRTLNVKRIDETYFEGDA
jgi:restriction system protein